MLCCLPASDGIMLMYELWRGALFYLLHGDMGRSFYLQRRGMRCSSHLLCLSACLLRVWWKRRDTLSRWQTSIRGATCQGRGESSTGQMKGIGLVRQGRSLRHTSVLALSALNAPLCYSQWPAVCMWTVATLHSSTGWWLMLPYCICQNLCYMCVFLGCQHIQSWKSSRISLQFWHVGCFVLF